MSPSPKRRKRPKQAQRSRPAGQPKRSQQARRPARTTAAPASSASSSSAARTAKTAATATARPRQWSTILAVGALVWLLIDLLRAWTPLLITVFGRAAETPAELIGAFALAITAAPLALLWGFGRQLTRTGAVLQGPAILALAARAGVISADGRTLLAVTSVGVIAALVAVAIAAARAGSAFVPGLFAGIALAATTHATLGTWGAIWRFDLDGLIITFALCFAAWRAALHLSKAPTTDALPRRVAWLTLPVILLAGLALANPARALVAEPRGAIIVAAASALAALLTVRTWPVPARWVAALGVVGATALVMLPDPLPAWSLLGFAVGMPCLAIALGSPPAVAWSADSAAPGAPQRAARAVAGSAIAFTALLFAFYAGYDLGYRADWLIPLVALAAMVVALVPAGQSLARSADPATGSDLNTRMVVQAGVVVVAALLAWGGPLLTLRPLPQQAPAATDRDHSASLTVAAYNVRMGYGIDGTFRPYDVAALLESQGSDVVLLSEVDRGWLLNGGQDQLTVLARLLGSHVAFGPAADQVWGDAILSIHPLSDVQSLRLPKYDSLTGAQVLAATVTPTGGQPFRVVSTHIQPDSSGDEPSLRQAQDIRTFVAEQQQLGMPVVLGGDFNLEPGGAEFEALTTAVDGQSTLVDALAERRPLLTSSSDDLRKQIDHVFITPDLQASNARTVRTLLSDHLPVFVTVTRR